MSKTLNIIVRALAALALVVASAVAFAPAAAADCQNPLPNENCPGGSGGSSSRDSGPRRCFFGRFFCADQDKDDPIVVDQPTKTCGGWFQPRCGNGSGSNGSGPTCGGLFQPRCDTGSKRRDDDNTRDCYFGCGSILLRFPGTPATGSARL